MKVIKAQTKSCLVVPQANSQRQTQPSQAVNNYYISMFATSPIYSREFFFLNLGRSHDTYSVQRGPSFLRPQHPTAANYEG